MSSLKQTITEMIKHILSEATEGEMQFAPLEAARKAYLQDPNDETKHQLGQMVNKIVEPLMAEMGLFWEAEAYYNRGDLVFNNRSVDITIDPKGAMGRYDVEVLAQVSAMDTDPDFEPMRTSLDSMKGVVQFINDKVFKSSGMVGEPEGQGELPFKESLNRDSLRKMVSQAVIQELTFREQGRVKKGSPVIYRRVEAPDYKERREYRGRWMGFTDKTKLDSMVEFDAGKGPDGSDFLRIETAELMLDN
tara:strand:- start:562 stop:1305 length:744 start_codon:yes stop_codon:yes gene_type:complete